MTQTGELSGGDGVASRAALRAHDRPAPLDQVPERPALAPNVELTGELQGSGFTDRQWLLQRDGQFIQLTELLYRVAEHADGQRTLEEIADRVTASTEWLVTAGDVRQLIQTKLIPLGIVPRAEGSAEVSTGATRKRGSRSPLAINFRTQVIGPRVIEPIARALQFLYAPPILIPVLIVAAAAHGWLYLTHSVTAIFLHALYQPGALLVLLAVMAVAGAFHELGHATALRYGGGKVRGMGVGVYLIYPALYTDVTDSYRLGRWARVRTDLGGFYFHLIFAVGAVALYFLTGQEVLLLAVVLINIDILYQLMPFVRLDGYWALADLTGIPDLLSQIGPFLASLRPGAAPGESRLPPLKPWVRRVFVAYILLTLPMLALLYLFMMKRLPLLLSTTWDSLIAQARLFSIAQDHGALAATAVVGVNMLLLALFALMSMYLFYGMSRAVLRALWSRSGPTRRLTAVAGTAVLAALTGFFWAPHLPRLAGSAAPAGVESFTVAQPREVLTSVDYEQTPPVGGDHAPEWQNCGFYGAPVANENAVHSMEHGAVWITFRPDLPAEQIDALRQRTKRQPYLLVSAYPDLPAPIVASAWGHQLRLASVDDPALDRFVRAFRLGDQAPERGNPCTGGVGLPE